MKIRKIGIVLETYDDALATGVQNTDHLYHWREPDEIAQIIEAVENSGYTPVILGTPGKICGNIELLRSQVDLILNLSVGFLSRFRLSLPPALFEVAGIPYTGADPYTRMISQNKHIQKSFFDSQAFLLQPGAISIIQKKSTKRNIPPSRL